MTTQPKSPHAGWRCLGGVPNLPGAVRWLSESEPLSVVSAVEIVDDKDSPVVRPHFHVSALALHPVRLSPDRSCTDEELARVRAAFGMDGADEDNHGRGLARHLWLDCSKRVETPCPCKQDEETFVEGPREWRP